MCDTLSDQTKPVQGTGSLSIIKCIGTTHAYNLTMYEIQNTSYWRCGREQICVCQNKQK